MNVNLDVKLFVVMSVLLIPYALLNANGEDTKVEIAEGSKKVDNGKFFTPARISVPVGTTVVWTNHDDSPHTVTSGTKDCVGHCWGLDFDSGILRQDRSFKFTFDKPGTFNYLCSIHPWMAGTVKVLAEGATDVDVDVDLKVETDKTTYMPGDNVSIKGNVSPVVEDEQVVIEVINPTREQFRSEKVMVEDDGEFNYDFKLEGDLVLGSYTVKVIYSDETEESVFNVEKPGRPEPGMDTTEVNVAAKRVKDLIIMRVKNSGDSSTGLYGISVQVQDSVIEAFKGPRGWSSPDTPSGLVTSLASDRPIEPGEKAVFKIKLAGDGTVIKWTALDADGKAIDEGDARLISR
jgi:plastocyanin